MNLQKEKKKILWQIRTNRYRHKKITGLDKKMKIIDWMMIDWGNPPYDTSGSLREVRN
jgi:hypothetical protein